LHHLLLGQDLTAPPLGKITIKKKKLEILFQREKSVKSKFYEVFKIVEAGCGSLDVHNKNRDRPNTLSGLSDHNFFTPSSYDHMSMFFSNSPLRAAKCECRVKPVEKTQKKQPASNQSDSFFSPYIFLLIEYSTAPHIVRFRWILVDSTLSP
jgi:hypothetical protein